MVADGLRVVGVCWRGVGEVFGVALFLLFMDGHLLVCLFVFMFDCLLVRCSVDVLAAAAVLVLGCCRLFEWSNWMFL